VPVTIKVRLAMDDSLYTYLHAGEVAEGEGCSYIALHGRTARQLYSGRARWEPIRLLKEHVRIPVLGNGDIFAAPDAFRMLAETGCDGVVIGRGCLGNPWLFQDLKRLFDGAGVPERPAVEEVLAVIREHFALLVAHYAQSPRSAGLMMRKFGAWYARGFKEGATFRRDFQRIESASDLETILERMLAAGYESGLPDPGEGTRAQRLEEALAGGAG
jgi:nifR3 family TIM-barrel protein